MNTYISTFRRHSFVEGTTIWHLRALVPDNPKGLWRKLRPPLILPFLDRVVGHVFGLTAKQCSKKRYRWHRQPCSISQKRALDTSERCRQRTEGSEIVERKCTEESRDRQKAHRTFPYIQSERYVHDSKLWLQRAMVADRKDDLE